MYFCPSCSDSKWTSPRRLLSRSPWRASPPRSSVSGTPACPSRSWGPGPSTRGRGCWSRCTGWDHVPRRPTSLLTGQAAERDKRKWRVGAATTQCGVLNTFSVCVGAWLYVFTQKCLFREARDIFGICTVIFMVSGKWGCSETWKSLVWKWFIDQRSKKWQNNLRLKLMKRIIDCCHSYWADACF